jgi:hypothetical protein
MPAHPRSNGPFTDLPTSFREEKRVIEQAGLASWSALRDLDALALSQLARQGRATARNLRRLQGIAALVCDLDLAPADAALLMHAGLATIPALAAASPQDVVNRTGRLERQLRTGRPPVVDLAVAQRWIQRARRWQPTN